MYKARHIKDYLPSGQRKQRVINELKYPVGILLIDEYDKPLLDTIELPELQDMSRNKLRGIYGNLKKTDSYIASF